MAEPGHDHAHDHDHAHGGHDHAHGEGHDHAHGHGHGPRFLAHHFDSMDQQFDAAKLGMWLFLATEVLLFAGLFCFYTVFRGNHPEVFHYASTFLDRRWGAVNTIVLLISSFTAAMAVRTAQLGRKDDTVKLLAATLVCAGMFLVVKYFEYSAKFEHHLLPGIHFAHHEPAPAPPDPAPVPPGPPAPPPPAPAAFDAPTPWSSNPLLLDLGNRSVIAPAARSPGGLAVTAAPAATEHGTALPEASHEPVASSAEHRELRNVHIFFGVYFVMTGTHGLHVIFGMIAITWVLLRTRRGDFSPQYYVPVDLVALYWHLVDLIWIYLFPLLYLVG